MDRNRIEILEMLLWQIVSLSTENTKIETEINKTFQKYI